MRTRRLVVVPAALLVATVLASCVTAEDPPCPASGAMTMGGDPSTASTYLRLALDRFGEGRVGRAWLGPGPDGVTTIYLDLADPSTRDRWTAERLRHRAGTGYPVEVVAVADPSSDAGLPPCARPIRP